MIDFSAPWFILALPLPVLAYYLLPVAKQQQTALRVPFFQRLAPAADKPVNQQQPRWISLLAVIAWLFLVAAATQPRWLGDPVNLPQSGRDVMLAVDLSGSMQREDMQIGGQLSNRLIAVKAVLRDFIQRRQGDRLGLIVFGSQAYIQSPLTFDRNTVEQLLLESQIGFAGENTAIGDAIGLATKRLRKRPGNEHVLILLTDGANTAGEVTPLAAANIAAENNIKIYTIGIGADRLETRGFFGFSRRTVNPSADLDEATLTEIAKLTGGQYFRARNPQELLAIYAQLDELEPVIDEKKTFRPKKHLFYWPLSLAMIISMVLVARHSLSNSALTHRQLSLFKKP